MIVSSKLRVVGSSSDLLTGGNRKTKTTLTVSGIRAEIITREVPKDNRIANHSTTSLVNFAARTCSAVNHVVYSFLFGTI
jgi:hypothetical protein